MVEIMMGKLTLDGVILNDAKRECGVGHGSPTGLGASMARLTDGIALRHRDGRSEHPKVIDRRRTKAMPTKKARGKSKASRATGKKRSVRKSARKSTGKKSAPEGAQRTQFTSLKKTVRRRGPGVVKSVKEVAGAVMAAAAAGALKGAVTAVLPPVMKATGVTQESRETKGPGEVPGSQDHKEIRQDDTT